MIRFSAQAERAFGLSAFLGFGFVCVALLGSGCTPKTPTPDSAESKSASSVFQKGKAIYQANCIACHSPDPKKDGPLGPSVFGSSRPLLEARVLRGEYPEGYKPKRSTRVMVPLPQLKDDIESLYVYLNDLK